MEPVGILSNGQHTLSGRNSHVFDFRRVFILCCPYSISNRLGLKLVFVPVTRCRQLSCVCARSLRSNCQHIIQRTCFSRQVRVWGIHHKVFRVWPIRDICMRTVSGKIDRVSAIVLSEAFGSSCRNYRIIASVSYRSGLPVCPSLRSSSFPRRLR
jgi:hypothetical protein